LADRDDAVLAVGQPARDNFAVKHPLPVVFSAHTKRSEIMNRRDECAGSRPEHAPIAWDVQHVEAMAVSQPGEDGLVPKNVFHRRPEPLRDFNNFAMSAREIEERQIVLESKDREMMSVVPGEQSTEQCKNILSYSGFAALNH
jgi:hypothetical protein